MRHSAVAALAGALFAAAVTATGALAAEEEDFMIDDTGDLGVLCGTPADHPRYASAIHMCQGYLLGAHHFHTAMAAAGSAEEPGIYCVPTTGAPSRDEAIAEFSAWVASQPDVAALPAIEGLMRWAKVRFPCN